MTSAASTTIASRDTTMSVRPEDAEVLRAMVVRLAVSWAGGDAAAMALLYAEDASVVLPGDVYLKGRSEILGGMASAFAGKWKDTHILGVPIEMRYITDDVCIMISSGGAYKPGAAEVSADDAIRGMWIFVRNGAEWLIAAYENTPVMATVPVPDASRMPVSAGSR